MKKARVVNQAKQPEPAAAPVVMETKDNGIALDTHGLRIVHVHNKGSNKGGLTVAFKSPEGYKAGPGKGKASTVQIATALCHPADNFNKKIGTQLAVANFLSGNTITVPVDSFDIPGSLRDMFHPSNCR